MSPFVVIETPITPTPPPGDDLLLMTGDNLLLMTGDDLLLMA
jgi:hypothetical protein